jgi:catechol 2,3-dioxygenase-like lactoylglutathione lyase family enzyme
VSAAEVTGWRKGLGAVRQLGNVVTDIDGAIAEWLALGVGPWFVMRDVLRREATFRGQASESRMSLAFANSGDLQIELIEPLDDMASAPLEFLQAGRTGMHHIAYWTDRYDDVMADAAAAGWQVIQTSAGRSAYFEFPGGHRPLVEIMELNDRTRWLTDSVREAAQDWDGVADPVRSVPKRPGW